MSSILESGGSAGRAVAVLGSTGSVGRAAVEVARTLGLEVRALAGGADLTLVARQAADLEPRMVCVRRKQDAAELSGRIAQTHYARSPEVVWGDEGLEQVSTHEAVSTVVVALASAAGLPAALAAVKSGKKLALATKEIAVAAGSLLRRMSTAEGSFCVPVDSELSALHQMFQVHAFPSEKEVSRIGASSARIIASVADEKVRKRLVDAARRGAPTTAIERKVQRLRQRERELKAQPTKKRGRALKFVEVDALIAFQRALEIGKPLKLVDGLTVEIRRAGAGRFRLQFARFF